MAYLPCHVDSTLFECIFSSRSVVRDAVGSCHLVLASCVVTGVFGLVNNKTNVFLTLLKNYK